uniref:Uncharacterized protein n=1 Tax=Strongyloides venezuelensis TaxID=75913 RepID=A0A0K0FWE2_STRVS
MDSHNLTNINYDEVNNEKTIKMYCVKTYNWNE